MLQVFAVSVIRLSPKTGKMSMEKLTQSFFLSCHTHKKRNHSFFFFDPFLFLASSPIQLMKGKKKKKKKYNRGMARTKEKKKIKFKKNCKGRIHTYNTVYYSNAYKGFRLCCDSRKSHQSESSQISEENNETTSCFTTNVSSFFF